MLLLRSPFNAINDFDNDFSMVPYWNNLDHSSFSDFANTVGEITNNDHKFSVQLDVSHFRPENLKIHLNGRELTIDGEQELKNKHGYTKRSFSRMILLPEDADLSRISSKVTHDGKLAIKVEKTVKNGEPRKIPIAFHATPKKQIEKA